MIVEMEHLLLDRDGPVATLTINRPDRLNALTFAMFSRLPALLAEAQALDGVRVLVLRGGAAVSRSATLAVYGCMTTSSRSRPPSCGR